MLDLVKYSHFTSYIIFFPIALFKHSGYNLFIVVF